MFNRASHFFAIAILVILGLATVIRLADPFFAQRLRLIAFDSYQMLDPAVFDPSLPVKLVDIDEDSLERIGQWPWSRLVLANLLDQLTRQGAAVVAFDVVFSEADRTSPEQMIAMLSADDAAAVSAVVGGRPSHDEIFGAAIGRSPVVLATALADRPSPPPPEKAGFSVLGDDPRPFIRDFAGATANLPILEEPAKGIGAINWIPDRDQVVRRLPLIYRIGEQFVPTLVTEALRIAFQQGTYVLKSSNASGENAFGVQTGLNNIRVGDFVIPTDPDGAIWLRFRPANPASYIPAWQVLAGENDTNQIAGSIVIVGTSAPGLLDLRATPLDPSIPGAEVHVQAIEHILRQSGLVGPPEAPITRPDYMLGVELAIMILLGLAMAWLLPKVSAFVSVVIGFAVIGSVLLGGFVAYRSFRLLYDPTFTALVLFLLVTTVTIYVYRRSEQQKGEVRKAFGYYVSPTVVNEIVKHPDKLELGGVVRELSVLFCDVRNFTSISERMTAHELTRFINNLLTPLSEVILDNRGTIDKYIGDAIMAFWNAPLDDERHAEHALTSALTMIRRMESLNEEWRAQAQAEGKQYAEVAIGIGINSGNCCVGNLGSSQRFDYSAIGDDVNIASRLEGLSKVYGVPIVLGETTVHQVNGLKTVELDLMRVKGRAQPLRIFTASDALGYADDVYGMLAPKHASMLDRYRGRDWDGAETLITECEAISGHGLAGLYAVYRGRIAEWRESAPPPDWDGTFTATSK